MPEWNGETAPPRFDFTESRWLPGPHVALVVLVPGGDAGRPAPPAHRGRGAGARDGRAGQPIRAAARAEPDELRLLRPGPAARGRPLRRDLRAAGWSSNGSFGTWAVPRVALAFRLGGTENATTLRASAGAGIKEPSFFESYGVSFFAQGNPDLDPERSRTVDGGIEQRLFENRLRVQVTGYYHDYRDQITYTIVDFTTFEGTYVNLEQTRARGVEVEVEGRPRPWLQLFAELHLPRRGDPGERSGLQPDLRGGRAAPPPAEEPGLPHRFRRQRALRLRGARSCSWASGRTATSSAWTSPATRATRGSTSRPRPRLPRAGGFRDRRERARRGVPGGARLSRARPFRARRPALPHGRSALRRRLSARP